MINFQRKLPQYITEKGNIVRLILFTAAFALVFINFYAPFGVTYWFRIPWWKLLFYSSLVILTGVLVVVISRIIMFRVRKRMELNLGNYVLWVLAEVFFMALFYALFEKMIFSDDRQFLPLLKKSVQNTALVLLLPYSAMWLYLSYRDKKLQLEKIAGGDRIGNTAHNMIPFHDEKDILRFSVTRENLLYLESSDNYVNICYLNKGKVSRFLLRNTLKHMEELFSQTDIVRCHRSYMVNFDKVKVIRREKDGLLLELDLPSTIDIPVSRTYVANVMDTFAKYSKSF